jgi:DNA-binding MarR family transcriptional regulator
MAPHHPSDPEITTWLTTVGITSRCQWDVLVFLARHQTTLLGAADLARLLGYPSDAIVVALDGLETQALVTRSRVSQGARLYHCCVLPDGPRQAALAHLLTLAADRVGRVRVAQQLRPDATPMQKLDQAQHFLRDAQQRLRLLRSQADARRARRTSWQQAL